MNIVKEYMTEIESDGKSKETLKAFRNTIQMFFRWKLEESSILLENISDKEVLSVNSNDIRKYKIYMSSVYKKTGANTKLRYLGGFWNWMLKMKYVNEDIFEKISNFEEPSRKPISMDLGEVNALLSHVDSLKYKFNHRDHVMFSVLLSSGLRISELLDLKPSMITVARYDDGDSYGFDIIGKGDKQRDTILTERVYNDLMKYIIKNDIKENEKIFNVSARTVQRNMKKYAKSAGLEDGYTPHKLRHTFATMLYESDVQIEEISKYLGHQNTGTTTDFYVKISNKQKRKASRSHPLNMLDM